ncbi:nuclear transport factor 2 family protein [Sabulilitoribacter multivorans]|uniref:Nuclear transport factor 2 family protein n=1 Tax=Flaviramulus multivorans TaxID=1304750 RepID=A0ABS9IMJ8_9FLAO|nr:nuclear transport factor 2 family protein [Flaviramulus multivorans]MCF7561820.1 nuclear transport factor 2 family protein [Flaviramulus multivorans]
MNKKEIAQKYLHFLEHNEIDNIITLFSKNGLVTSPVYGIKKARTFYKKLFEDTTNSKLTLKGIFEDNDSNKIAIYFNYNWTLIDNSFVEFDVVDILEFDADNKIKHLNIIYDSVITRQLVANLNK